MLIPGRGGDPVLSGGAIRPRPGIARAAAGVLSPRTLRGPKPCLGPCNADGRAWRARRDPAPCLRLSRIDGAVVRPGGRCERTSWGTGSLLGACCSGIGLASLLGAEW